MVISEHRDGEIIARIAESLGYATVRGSTSRGASRALLGLDARDRRGARRRDHARRAARAGARRSLPAPRSRRSARARRSLPIARQRVARVAAQELGSIPHSEAVRACQRALRRRSRRGRGQRRAKRPSRRRGSQRVLDARAGVVSCTLAERVWYGDTARRARVARGALAPASWLYGAVAALRNRMYDAGVLRSQRARIAEPRHRQPHGRRNGEDADRRVGRGASARARRAAGHRPARLRRRRAARARAAESRTSPVIADADRVRGVAMRAASGRGLRDARRRLPAPSHPTRMADWRARVAPSAGERGRRAVCPPARCASRRGAAARATLVDRHAEGGERRERLSEVARAARRPVRRARPCAVVPPRAGRARERCATARACRSSALAARACLRVAAIGAPDGVLRAAARSWASRWTSAVPRSSCVRSATMSRRIVAPRAVARRWSSARSRTPSSSLRCWPRAAPPLWYVSQQRRWSSAASGELDASLDDHSRGARERLLNRRRLPARSLLTWPPISDCRPIESSCPTRTASSTRRTRSRR